MLPFLKSWICELKLGPVVADLLALRLQQVDSRVELILCQLVRIRDPQVGLRRLQVDGGVGDVDRAVVRRHLARVAGAVEHHAPAVGRRLDDVGVVHEDVGAPLVGHAVVDAVDRVVRRRLQRRGDVLEVGDQVGVDRHHVAAGDQPVGGVAGRRHAVVLARAHQLHHLVRGLAVLDLDLAPGLLLERLDDVGLGVALPGDQIEPALALADRRRQARRAAYAAGAPGIGAGRATATRGNGHRRHGERSHGDSNPHAETSSSGSLVASSSSGRL